MCCVVTTLDDCRRISEIGRTRVTGKLIQATGKIMFCDFITNDLVCACAFALQWQKHNRPIHCHCSACAVHLLFISLSCRQYMWLSEQWALHIFYELQNVYDFNRRRRDNVKPKKIQHIASGCKCNLIIHVNAINEVVHCCSIPLYKLCRYRSVPRGIKIQILSVFVFFFFFLNSLKPHGANLPYYMELDTCDCVIYARFTQT